MYFFTKNLNAWKNWFSNEWWNLCFEQIQSCGQYERHQCSVLTGSSDTSCDSFMAVKDDVFTVRPSKSTPSVSAVAAASALANALRERHKPTLWDIFIYALHLTGVDPCHLSVCAVTVLSIMGKSGEKVGLAGPNPTLTLVAGELGTGTWGAPQKHQMFPPYPPTLQRTCLDWMSASPYMFTNLHLVKTRKLVFFPDYIKKALGVSVQAVTSKGWARIRSNLILFTSCLL